MIRFIIFTLAIGIIFLSGMIVGMNENKGEEVVKEEDHGNIEEIDIEHNNTHLEYDVFKPDNDKGFLIHKVASTVERLISFLYELLITLMYKFAKLFT